jgi:hypothetical protein
MYVCLLCQQPVSYLNQQEKNDGLFQWLMHMVFAHDEIECLHFNLKQSWCKYMLVKETHNHNYHIQDFQRVYNKINWECVDILEWNGRWLGGSTLMTMQVWESLPVNINMLRTGSGISNAIACEPDE